jgi:hypothetical protein
MLIYFFIFVITCQKFCSVSGGNLIKHIFSSKSMELYVSVEGLNKIGPALSYHLVCPYFGNALNLGSTHIGGSVKGVRQLGFEFHRKCFHNHSPLTTILLDFIHDPLIPALMIILGGILKDK